MVHLGVIVFSLCSRQMQKALQDAMAPDGVWDRLKEKGRVHQTCTRFAGRLIDAVARLGNMVCAPLLRHLCAVFLAGMAPIILTMEGGGFCAEGKEDGWPPARFLVS